MTNYGVSKDIFLAACSMVVNKTPRAVEGIHAYAKGVFRIADYEISNDLNLRISYNTSNGLLLMVVRSLSYGSIRPKFEAMYYRGSAHLEVLGKGTITISRALNGPDDDLTVYAAEAASTLFNA